MTKCRLLLNPASGRGRGARRRARLVALADAAGIGFEESSSGPDLTVRARRAAAEGIDRLLVAGGDGTLHWTAQGLAGSDTALAPLALGTGNDMARELGYPLDFEAAYSLALEAPVERIDLGRIGDRRFCVVAGVGFDAAVSEYARSRVRRLRGPAVYAWATLASLASFRAPYLELETDAGSFSGEVFLVAFANGSHYGGGMRIAPRADPADGRLEVVIVRRMSKLRLLGVFPRVYRGSHVGHSAVELLSVRRASLAMRPSQLINIDGEGFGDTGGRRLEVSVEPAALAVVRAAPRRHDSLH